MPLVSSSCIRPTKKEVLRNLCFSSIFHSLNSWETSLLPLHDGVCQPRPPSHDRVLIRREILSLTCIYHPHATPGECHTWVKCDLITRKFDNVFFTCSLNVKTIVGGHDNPEGKIYSYYGKGPYWEKYIHITEKVPIFWSTGPYLVPIFEKSGPYLVPNRDFFCRD